MDEQRQDREHRLHRLRDARAWIHARPHVHLPYKIAVGVVGAVVIVVGLILVPLPGPGWLIVFIGLTILASEFAFFHRISTWLRVRLQAFWDRAKRHAPGRRQRGGGSGADAGGAGR